MELRQYQKQAIDELLARPKALLTAPTGSGKTLILCETARRLTGENILIIVTTSQIQRQFLSTLEKMEIPAVKYGLKKSAPVRVATWQKLAREYKADKGVFKAATVVLSDECHRISDETLYGLIVAEIDPKFHYAVTATPDRPNGIQFLLELCDGYRVNIPLRELYRGGYLIRPQVHWIETGRTYDSNEILNQWQLNNWNDMQLLGKFKAAVSEDSERNQRIARIAIKEPRAQHKLILCSTVAQVKRIFNECYRIADGSADGSADVYQIHGRLNKGCQASYFESIEAAKGRTITVATMAFLGEGVDIPKLDALFIACPHGGGNKVVQFAGRCLRPYPKKTEVNIYEFVDELPGIGFYWTGARAKRYRRLEG